jgi:hypothetical protein
VTATPARATRAALTIAFIALLWAHAAVGDEIITTTGDRLSGTIIEGDPHMIRLQTSYAGIVEIDRSQVQSLRCRAAQADPAGLACAGAGPITVADGARSAAQDATAGPAGASASTPARADVSRSSPFTEGSKLGGRINFALSHERGNTDQDEIDFDYQLEYRRGWHRFRSLGVLEYGTMVSLGGAAS